MNYELQTKKGFSLTEVLLSIGILSVGMIFIAGVFPVAIYFTATATERTIAAVAADEAFAKIRLYNIEPNIPADGQLPIAINPGERLYPSPSINPVPDNRQYYWSVLRRKVNSNPLDRNVQVTVFVCRGAGTFGPLPEKVGVSGVGSNVLQITDPSKITYINDGCTVVEDSTGRIYRVVERDAAVPDRIVLDAPWQGGNWVWVVPPPNGGGRYPCIAVYQKVIKF
jgi:prepilin-type N-terminal cleavage/methylation domain-containing protein